jgi:hypothetical protein
LSKEQKSLKAAKSSFKGILKVGFQLFFLLSYFQKGGSSYRKDIKGTLRKMSSPFQSPFAAFKSCKRSKKLSQGTSLFPDGVYNTRAASTAIIQEFIAVVMDRRPNLNSCRGFKKRNKILSHEKTPLSCWDMIRSIHLILPSVGSSSRNNNFVDNRLQIRSYILLVNSLLDEFIHHSISALVDITS